METLRDYIENIKRFSPEARLYLLVSMLQGIGWGVFQLFFNFYILSLGYQQGFMGLLISLPSITALFVALGAGYISDLIGRKRAFLLGGVLSVAAQLLMLIVPTQPMLIFSAILRGIGMSIFSVTAAPFLMENSTERERTHLFSFSSGISTMSSFLGNFLGGSLPALFAILLEVDPTSSPAYAWSLALTSVLNLVALFPLARLEVKQKIMAQSLLAPFKMLWEHRNMMTRLLLPTLVLSLGAGMLIPFLNIFFRFRYALPDDTIGTLFGIGSLWMGLAILIGPVLANRWGKAKTVVITQAISIPFLITLGFVNSLPLAVAAFWIRMALMNLSAPVYQTMVMEEADASSRGMAASLYSMIWNLGRAVSPSVSGPIQEVYGFDPVFISTILSYILSVYLVYRWFVKRRYHAQTCSMGLQPELVE
ncbi:MAG TPA: MFS transporter [Chloroflexi bacterium]|nr:MFS transporter [Chloroflexota bacterium]